MKYIPLFFKGISIGIANLVPGVSGGTVAVIFGVYDELVTSLNTFYTSISQFKEKAPFLAVVLLGCMTGIFAFSSLFEFMLTYYSFPTLMLFIGLIFGSVPLIYKKAAAKGVKPAGVISTITAAAAVAILSLLGGETSSSAHERETVIYAIQLLLAGAAVSAAMVIPGISGSLILLMLGLYYDVIHAVSSIAGIFGNPVDNGLFFNVAVTLLPLGAGIILGILVISKLISFLLQRHNEMTYQIILGLMIGSVFSIFTDPAIVQSGIGVIPVSFGIGTLTIGFIASYFLGSRK